MSGIHIASNSSTSISVTELFGGESKTVTHPYIVAIATVLAAHSILALNVSDELIEWVPGAVDVTGVAVGISCEAIDTTAGASSHPIYTGGYFNTDALDWPTGVTDTQKLNAFINTPISHRSLGYSG